MTQGMQFSAFKGPFAERIDAWNARLCMVSEVLEEWLAVQRAWLYLQPILDSPDINKQVRTSRLDASHAAVSSWCARGVPACAVGCCCLSPVTWCVCPLLWQSRVRA
jgi:Dynein heavy chain, N-terminal region 2